MTLKRPPQLEIDPPLLNSANPWATTLEHLRELYECPSTGAVTTRTTLLKGFNHQDAVHQYTFFNTSTSVCAGADEARSASLNTLGYSPLPLTDYLDFIKTISETSPRNGKPFIISVTGTPEEVSQCYQIICDTRKKLSLQLAMEINLSCPNIPNAPPPAYDGDSLRQYLDRLGNAAGVPEIPVGIKTPPYTHANDFKTLISSLSEPNPCKVSFITATNTLGSCLVLRPTDGRSYAPSLPGAGIGGMAGPPLHPLALGNVATIRKMLDEVDSAKHIRIIGVGGVGDAEGYKRMKSVGAYAVAVGTALGIGGVEVFSDIEKGLSGAW